MSAVASLHHMDARSGLVVLRNLVAPGGTLVVVGLAKPDFPKDIPHELAALVVNRIQPQPQDPDDVPKPPIIWPPQSATPRCAPWPPNYSQASAGSAISCGATP